MAWILLFLLAMNIRPLSESAPNRQPQLAAANGQVGMVFGSGGSILFAQSKDNGETFSAPVRVATLPVLALGHHRGPRIAFAGKTILISAVSGQTPATDEHAHGLAADGDLLLWRSTDGGRTWSQPVAINDVPRSAREGLHAMAADAQGHAAAVWLDLRAKGTRLYGAFSDDAGLTWSKNLLVYESPAGTICECCHPSLVSAGGGEFVVMFRNVLDGMRDMYVVRVRNGKVVAKPQKTGVNFWPLKACPMDGRSVALENGRVVSAWRREERVFLADRGREIPLGRGKDVSMTVGKKGPYVAWNDGSRIEVSEPGSAAPVTLSQSGAFPALTALSDGSVLAAWEESGSIATRRLR